MRSGAKSGSSASLASARCSSAVRVPSVRTISRWLPRCLEHLVGRRRSFGSLEQRLARRVFRRGRRVPPAHPSRSASGDRASSARRRPRCGSTRAGCRRVIGSRRGTLYSRKPATRGILVKSVRSVRKRPDLEVGIDALDHLAEELQYQPLAELDGRVALLRLAARAIRAPRPRRAARGRRVWFRRRALPSRRASACRRPMPSSRSRRSPRPRGRRRARRRRPRRIGSDLDQHRVRFLAAQRRGGVAGGERDRQRVGRRVVSGVRR